MRGDVDDGPKAMSGVHEHSYSTGNSEHLNNMKLCSRTGTGCCVL